MHCLDVESSRPLDEEVLELFGTERSVVNRFGKNISRKDLKVVRETGDESDGGPTRIAGEQSPAFALQSRDHSLCGGELSRCRSYPGITSGLSVSPARPPRWQNGPHCG
jgi:hypothetical protein